MESFVIDPFVIFIRLFRIIHCRCYLWISCNVMQYWIVELFLYSWKCWGWYLLYFYSKLKSCSLLIFFNVWKIRSVNYIPHRVDIFSYCKLFERLSVIVFKRWLKFRAKENLNKFIWFLQRSNLKFVTKSKSCFKYSSQTSNKNS